MDFVGACLDEVALEGLDGITPTTLWLRLKTRQEPFPLQLDEHTKQFLWNGAIVCTPELQFYTLPEERKPPLLFNRFDKVMEETGVVLEQEQYPDIYPIVEVEDTEAQVVGSCATYYTRKCVTSQVRKKDGTPLLTLDDVVQRWGDRLVIVASQQLRSQAISADRNSDLPQQLSVRAYCMLERIARSRCHGESTHGNNSLKCLGINPKTLFYLRRMLQRKHLIVTQSFNTRTLGGQNMGGRLLHVPRFYVKHEPRYCAWQKLLYEILSKQPHQRMILPEVRRQMNVTESAFKHFQKASIAMRMFETRDITRGELYPGVDLGMMKSKKPRSETRVRIVQLLPDYDPDNPKQDSDSEEEDEQARGPSGCLVMEKPLIVQVYELLLEMGGAGLRKTDLLGKFGLSKLDSRTVMRYLERLDLCQTVLHDQGKQRVTKYVANELLKDCEEIQHFNKEKQLVLDQRNKRGDENNPDLTTALQQDASELVTEEFDTSLVSQDGSEADSTGFDSSLVTLYSMAPEYIDMHKKVEGNVTYRWLSRANITLEMLNDMRMIDGVVELRRKIIGVEMGLGLRATVDRKSVLRILYRLHEGGHLNIVNTQIKTSDQNVKQLELFCHKDVSATDHIVTSYIENQMQKLQALTKMKAQKKIVQGLPDTSDEFTSVPLDSAQLNYALLSSKTLLKDLVHSPKAATNYGYKPKMRRAEILHKFLWYIVYGSENSPDEAKYIDREMDFSSYPSMEGETTPKSENPIPDSVLSSFKVHNDEISWRRFIPPITVPKGHRKGWFQTGDIILVMPISIFLALVRCNFKIPGVLEVLRDPIRRHLPVSQLPSVMRQSIMVHRRYLFSISGTLQQLCYLGMLSFAGREYREKHQVHCYLHQKARFMDTTLEEPEERLHVFDSYSAVTNYWFQLQYTAINTPLRSITLSDPGMMKHVAKMNLHFEECLRPIEPFKEGDCAVIPGDGLAACGMDSTQFLHLKRNWYWAYDRDVKLNALVDTQQRRRDTKGERRRKSHKHTKPGGVGAVPGGKEAATGDSKAGNNSTGLGETKKKESKRKSSGKPSPVTAAVEEFEKVKVSGDEAIPRRGGKGVKRKPVKEHAGAPQEKKAKVVRKKHDHYRNKHYTHDFRGKQVALYRCDKIDEGILENRVQDRVNWTDEEDSLLLMTVVTQRVLIYPHRRRDIILSYFTLRDLLHKISPRFRNKASKAIQRRMNYIMRKRETQNNTEVFVGEAMHDPAIRAMVKDKPYNRAMSQPELEKVFTEVYHLLREKFSALSVNTELMLPDTLAEIQTQCVVSTLQPQVEQRFVEVTNNNDICFWVLHNTIHCAMLLSDRTGRAHELFQLFNQYPEDLLLNVFNCMKTDGLITKLKSFQQSSRMLPWNKISLGNPGLGGYQVSQRYMYNWFAKQYARNVFESSSACLDEFLANPDQSREMEEKGGFTAVTVALMALRQIRFTTVIPENMITMLPRLEKHQGKKVTNPVLDPDDAEEDALIEEAERTRNQAKAMGNSEGGSTDAPAETESHIEFQDGHKSTSRLVVNLMHQTHYGFAAGCNYNPDNLLVVHECGISVELKPETVAIDRTPDLHKDLERRVQKTLTSYNHASPFLHPRSAPEILKRIRLTYPSEVDWDTLVADCQALYGYTESELSELHYLQSVVKETGSLGLLENTLLKITCEMARVEDHLALLQEYRMVSPLLHCTVRVSTKLEYPGVLCTVLISSPRI